MAVPYSFYLIPIFSVLTSLSSIVCLASKSTAAHSYTEVNEWMEPPIIPLALEFPGQRIALATYPAYLGLDATKLVQVASSVALVVSIGFAALAACVMLKRKPVRVSLKVNFHISPSNCFQLLWYHRPALLLILFANASLALAAFISSFVLHSQSEHFSLSYRSINGGFGYGDVYATGVFDLETWTCEVKDLPSFHNVSTLSQQCAAEVAARASTVIMFIFATGLLIGVWWDAHKHRALIVVSWEKDRMALDDEDDCELNDMAIMAQLEHIGLQKNRA
jgi:hypothetical protein